MLYLIVLAGHVVSLPFLGYSNPTRVAGGTHSPGYQPRGSPRRVRSDFAHGGRSGRAGVWTLYRD